MSVLLYGAGGVALALALQRPDVAPPREIEVSLQAPPPVRPSPPAPPVVAVPPAATTTPRPAATTPRPPPPKPVNLVAPTVVPDAPLPEADPIAEAPTSEVSENTGDSGAAAPAAPAPVAAPAPPSPAPAPAAVRRAPINLPEEAEPAEPADDNVPPEYPESARAQGLDAKVVLRIVVGEDGRVGEVQVLKPNEPGFEAFVEAALRAVRTWRYSPARVDGAVVASFKIVSIPFRIRR